MDSSAESPVRNDIELGPVTHWPTVYAVVGVAAVVLVGLAAVVVLAAVQPAPPADAPQVVSAVVPAPPPRPARTAVKPADPVTQPVEVVAAPEPEPARAEEPAPPQTPVTTAVTPLIRVSDPATEPEPPAPSPQGPPPEFALFDDLQAHTRQIDLADVVEGTAALRSRSGGNPGRKEAVQRTPNEPKVGPEKIMELMARRPDLAGLPVRGATECKTPAEAAQGIQEVSRALRRLQACLPPSEAPLHYDRTYAIDPETFYDLAQTPDRDKTIFQSLDRNKKILREETASTLAQMLQTEDLPGRLHLTQWLASIKGRPAGQALARQALFDLTPEVRAAAAGVLRDRPPEEYRQTLLDGFRHPWPPVADHAARALAALEDRGAVKDLEAMLDLPDPAAPALDEHKKWVKAEVVKVNHLRNCLLCHAPSSSERDLIRGFVPKPNVPLPASYEERGGAFVRADVTYLRQDFSLIEAVKDHGKWPLGQRFDYLVRRRPLTDEELIDMVDSDAPRALTPSARR